METFCTCPSDCGLLGPLDSGHIRRCAERASKVVEILREAGGSLPIAELRARFGSPNGLGEALSALLIRQTINHVGKRGTASAGYELAVRP